MIALFRRFLGLVGTAVLLWACGSTSETTPGGGSGAATSASGSRDASGGDGSSGGATAGGGAAPTGGDSTLGTGAVATNGGTLGSGAAAGAGGEGDAPSAGGSGGARSCEDFECPDLGTCGVEWDGSICRRVCHLAETFEPTTEDEFQALADLQCQVVDGTIKFGLSLSDDQLTQLGSIEEITGSLWPFENGSGFHRLKRIGCVLSRFAGPGTEIEFPALESIGVRLFVDFESEPSVLRFPALREIGLQEASPTCEAEEGYFAGMTIYEDRSLQRIDFPVLARIGGSVLIDGEAEGFTACMPNVEVWPSDATVDPGISVCLPDELIDTLSTPPSCFYPEKCGG